MKKRLFLIRHAKSDWSNPLQSDFDRPLNERGKKNAPFMGKRLSHEGIRPDLVVSSPAVRARTTAQAIAAETGYALERIDYRDTLYLADVAEIESVLHTLPETARTVFLVAHNPGLTLFAEYVSNHAIDNIPTCGIFEVELSGAWKNIGANTVRFVSFDYPKKHR